VPTLAAEVVQGPLHAEQERMRRVPVVLGLVRVGLR
jgi:hypothetical protein